MVSRRTTAVAAGVTVGLLLVAAPAAAKGGEVVGYGDGYDLTNGWQGRTDESFTYGRSADRVYTGNWNGRGGDTLAVRRGATYYFRDALSGGQADEEVTYGRSGDVVYMGDWNGDGTDTPVVRRGDTYYFKNSLSGGVADEVVTYGRSGDVVVVGDWNGDGVDTLGVRRGDTYYLKNSIRGGPADTEVTYGREDDVVVVGDWDGTGSDTLGVRRGNVFYVKNEISGGEADRTMAYGREGDTPLVGDWDGDGTDTVGLRRSEAPPAMSDRDAYDARMVQLINAERAAVGVRPVTQWTPLRAAAVRHSSWMVRHGRIEHAPRETIQGDARAAGCSAGGEHIVRTYQRGTPPDPRDAMDWYMNSEVHRRGILNPNNTYVAVGTVKAGDLVYNTQRFARGCS